MHQGIADSVARDGYAIVAEGLSPSDTDSILSDLAPVLASVTNRRGGARSVLRDAPSVRTLAYEGLLQQVAASTLGMHCFPVRALLFDKTPGANWKVAWHQDVTIAVKARREVSGFGPWTVKDEVFHVQPPASVLEDMIAVRLHLDECGLDNGPVRVLRGSHREGRLDPQRIQTWRKAQADVTCVVPRGGLLIMRPLLLHASSPAASPGHRRVLHVEYAAAGLPGGLQWYEAPSAAATAA